jgi:hypothetical protein
MSSRTKCSEAVAKIGEIPGWEVIDAYECNEIVTIGLEMADFHVDLVLPPLGDYAYAHAWAPDAPNARTITCGEKVFVDRNGFAKAVWTAHAEFLRGMRRLVK